MKKPTQSFVPFLYVSLIWLEIKKKTLNIKSYYTMCHI